MTRKPPSRQLHRHLVLDGDAQQIGLRPRAELSLQQQAIVRDGLIGDFENMGDFRHILAVSEIAQGFRSRVR